MNYCTTSEEDLSQNGRRIFVLNLLPLKRISAKQKNFCTQFMRKVKLCKKEAFSFLKPKFITDTLERIKSLCF